MSPNDVPPEVGRARITRRTFVGASVVLGGAAAAMGLLLDGCATDSDQATTTTTDVTMKINGADRASTPTLPTARHWAA